MSVREPTESIHLDEDEVRAARESEDAAESIDSADVVPDVARGTGMPPEDRTKVATPAARNRTGQESRPSARKPAPQPRPRESPDERLGDVLGSYRIIDVLGRGGMGFVYRAEHVKLGREVALKLLRADYSKRRDAVARFFQEARTVNRIRHRNIVDVTDFVELDDGTTFIIMELLRGQSLGRWARQGFDLPRALAVLIQICDGLAAAHTVGVIHRDLKPDNVFIVPTPDGAELVKLLDFGVAKLVNRDDEDVGLETAAGSVIGTPAYMSPEQAGGMPVDARADIYSVGAIMYEMFTGQPMFRGRSFGEYVRKHLSELPVRPRATPGGGAMDERLEGAILRSIEKDPNRRYGSIAELRDVLLHLLGAIETRPSRELFDSSILPSVAGGMPIQISAPTAMPTPLPLVVPIGPGNPGHPGPYAPTALGPAPMPAMVPTMIPTMHPPVAMQTGVSSISALHASAVHQTAPPPRATPWWVWFAGGALAVGLGIGGAVWVVTREDAGATPAAAAPPPAPEPAVPTPPAPTGPRLVQIDFTSAPPAGVFAVGSATELCRTPCTLDVDLRDGGAEDHRDFVLRAAGYRDAPTRVAITGDRIAVGPVALQADAPPPTASDDDRPSRRRDRDRKVTRTPEPPPRDPPKDPDPPPRDPPKTTPKDPPKIDRTDTIDPFAPRSP
jgi:eukaryotic-like serine/threonine-protein kinase